MFLYPNEMVSFMLFVFIRVQIAVILLDTQGTFDTQSSMKVRDKETSAVTDSCTHARLVRYKERPVLLLTPVHMPGWLRLLSMSVTRGTV